MTKCWSKLRTDAERHGGGFFLLLDPDRTPQRRLSEIAESAQNAGVDALLVGSSFTMVPDFDRSVQSIKRHTSVPVILFPGSHAQITGAADAVLFLCMLSSRNPAFLVDEQVKGAPLIHRLGLESIPTAYLLIESGSLTSAQFVSNSFPLPRDKHDLVCAHALAAKYMGMQAVYLEAGSGAKDPVPPSLIASVAACSGLDIITGGGIRRPEEIYTRVAAGAKFLVVGDQLEQSFDLSLLRELTAAAHPLTSVIVT